MLKLPIYDLNIPMLEEYLASNEVIAVNREVPDEEDKSE